MLAVADTHHRHALPGLTCLSALQALHYLSLHKVPARLAPLQLQSMQAGWCLQCCGHGLKHAAVVQALTCPRHAM